MTGDTDDMRMRLRALLPPWFADDAPIRDAVLGGIAAVLAFLYGAIAYARRQTRIATATDTWLDLIAFDFFGHRFRRRPAESDDAFRPRIIHELLRPRVTRPALVEALTALTGRPPIILEMFNSGDCGGYGLGGFAYAGGSDGIAVSGYGDPAGGYGAAGEFAYATPTPGVVGSPGAGCWGSLEYPFQTFITAYRPASTGIPTVAGYGGFGGGYGAGGLAYIDIADTTAAVADDEIYATIANTVAAGTIGWTAIRS